MRALYSSRKEVEGGDEQYIRELYNIRKLTALWKNWKVQQGGKEALTVQVTFEQRLEGGDEQMRIYLEEKHPGQRH